MASSSRQEAIRALKEMFPGLEERTIKASLLTSKGDVNSAAEWLLVEGLATPVQASTTASPAPAAALGIEAGFPRLPLSSASSSSSPHRGVASIEPSAATLSVEPPHSVEEEVFSSPSLSPSSEPVDLPSLPSFLICQQASEPSLLPLNLGCGLPPPASSTVVDGAGGRSATSALPVCTRCFYPNLMDSVPLSNPTSDPSSFVPSVQQFGKAEEGDRAVEYGKCETATSDAARFALAASQDEASTTPSEATPGAAALDAGQGQPADAKEKGKAPDSTVPAVGSVLSASSEASALASVGSTPVPAFVSRSCAPRPADNVPAPSSLLPKSTGLSSRSAVVSPPVPEVTVVNIPSDSESEFDSDEEESECQSLEESESDDEGSGDETQESEDASDDESVEETVDETEDEPAEEEEEEEEESEDESEAETEATGSEAAEAEAEAEAAESEAEAEPEGVVVEREREEGVQGEGDFESVQGDDEAEGEGLEPPPEMEDIDGEVVEQESAGVGEGEVADVAGEEEAEDALEVVLPEEGTAAGQADSETLSWSVGSFSVLGSHLDVSSFSTGFDSVLGRSSALKDELREGIESVKALQVRLSEAPAEAERLEAELQMARVAEEEQQSSMAWRLQHAREGLDARASEIAGERSTLHFEARLLLNRARELSKGKEDVKAQLAELKAVLSGRVEEVEARIEGVAREMRALHEAQRQRRSAEQDEMDALAARKQSLDDEESDCTQLKQFLLDRSQALDTIESGLLQCAEKIQALHQTILAAPLAPASAPGAAQALTQGEGQGQGVGASQATSFVGSPGPSLGGSGVLLGGEGAGSVMSFASASQHSEHSQAGLGGDGASANASVGGEGAPAVFQRVASQRGAMREALGPLLSSSEGSASGAPSAAGSGSSASPSLYASAEAFAADPRSAAVHTLSLMEREQLAAAARHASLLHALGVPASAAAAGAGVPAPEEPPIVRVFEGEGEGGGDGDGEGVPAGGSVHSDGARSNAAEGVPAPGAPAGSESPDRDGDWDFVSHPEQE